MASLDDLMRLYARRGVDDWKAAPQNLHSRALKCLGMAAIAQRYAEAEATINTVFDGQNAGRLKFIPMPQCNSAGIERCFFLPIREQRAGGHETIAFDLLLLVREEKCLAFRFEPADRQQSTHGYGHVQFNRKMLKRTIEVLGVPEWVPEKYPAFPISTSNPLRVFLCMATAVHGYRGGLEKVLTEIFQRASRTPQLASYLKELKEMLT